MLVVSVLSLKGGVGKTSVTLGLAGAAWQRGLRVLVIDLDPQANASTVLDPQDVRRTSHDVLLAGTAGSLADAVAVSGWGDEVGVVVAETSLATLEAAPRDGSLRLRKAMAGLDADGWDLVLLDSPPALGELTRNALAAAHCALVVTEPTLFALHGAQQALSAVEAVRQAANLRLTPAGIVVNKARPWQTEHAFRLGELRDAYGELLFAPPIPDRAAVQQAAGAFLPVQAWRSEGAREVADVLDDYLERLLTTDRPGGPLRGQSDL